MFEAGGARAVAQGRVDISETIRKPLVEVIERHTERKVVGFMSSSQQDPDLLSFIFVLDTSPLLEVIEGDGEGETNATAADAAGPRWGPRIVVQASVKNSTPILDSGAPVSAVRVCPAVRGAVAIRLPGAGGAQSAEEDARASAGVGIAARLRVDDEDAAATVLGDRRGDAAEEDFRQAGPAARPDHDSAGVELIPDRDNPLPGARCDLDPRLGGGTCIAERVAGSSTISPPRPAKAIFSNGSRTVRTYAISTGRLAATGRTSPDSDGVAKNRRCRAVARDLVGAHGEDRAVAEDHATAELVDDAVVPRLPDIVERDHAGLVVDRSVQRGVDVDEECFVAPKVAAREIYLNGGATASGAPRTAAQSASRSP